MKLKISFVLLFALTFLLSSGCGKKEGDPSATSNDPIKLELKLKQGDKFEMSMDMKQKIGMKVAEKEMTMDQNMNFDLGMMVKEVKADGNSVIANTFKHISMKMTNPMMGGTIEADTKNDTASGMGGMMLAQFKKMVGLTYDMEFDKTGAIKNSNLKDVMEKLNPGSGGKSAGMDNMQGQTVPFPDHAVKPGDSWSAEIERDIVGQKIKFKSTYTLKEVKGGVAKVLIDGKLLGVADGKEMGTIKGDFDINVANGFTNGANMKMIMAMEMDQGGKKIPMNIDTDIKITAKAAQ